MRLPSLHRDIIQNQQKKLRTSDNISSVAPRLCNKETGTDLLPGQTAEMRAGYDK